MLLMGAPVDPDGLKPAVLSKVYVLMMWVVVGLALCLADIHSILFLILISLVLAHMALMVVWCLQMKLSLG